MKRILNTGVAIISLSLFLGCEAPDYLEPNINNFTPKNLSANFLLVNAISSTDGGSLDFYLNNVKTGGSVALADAQVSYTNMALSTNAVVPTGTPVSNTGIRAKASTGSIGGVLGSSDLIFRAGNTNTNAFAAADSAFYTFIALDSLSRPKPLRTFNALKIGDTTYFNRVTGKYISVVTRDSIRRGLKPPFTLSHLTAIGTVPLGSTDPGGVRFLILTDQLPLPSTTRFPKPSAGRFAVRFVNAASDLSSVSVTVNGTTLSTGITSYPMNFPTFSPSVGSRATTASFVKDFGSLAPGNYDVVVKVGSTTVLTVTGADFTGDKGVYTIVLTGQRNKGNLKLVVIKNK